MHKNIFIVLLLWFCFNSTKAQKLLENDSTSAKKLFVAINATTIGYNLKYKNAPYSGDIQTYGSLNLGYKISKRARVQVGFSYGADKIDRSVIYVEAEDKLIYYDDVARTRGISIPISLDYTIFYLFKRIELYGTGMVTPIFSKTHQVKSERREDVTTVSYDKKTSGMNTYLTLGGGVRYRLNARFDAYFNYYRFSRNFNRNLARKDEYPYPGSLTLGLNYNFNLKWDK